MIKNIIFAIELLASGFLIVNLGFTGNLNRVFGLSLFILIFYFLYCIKNLLMKKRLKLAKRYGRTPRPNDVTKKLVPKGQMLTEWRITLLSRSQFKDQPQ